MSTTTHPTTASPAASATAATSPRRRRWSTGAFAAALALAPVGLAACGDDGEPQPVDPTPDMTTSDPQTPDTTEVPDGPDQVEGGDRSEVDPAPSTEELDAPDNLNE